MCWQVALSTVRFLYLLDLLPAKGAASDVDDAILTKTLLITPLAMTECFALGVQCCWLLVLYCLVMRHHTHACLYLEREPLHRKDRPLPQHVLKLLRQSAMTIDECAAAFDRPRRAASNK